MLKLLVHKDIEALQREGSSAAASSALSAWSDLMIRSRESGGWD